MSSARAAYSTMVGYDSTFKPGENRPGNDPNRQVYKPDSVTGRLPVADRGMNLIGFNLRLDATGSFVGEGLKQGGWISKALNALPFGINAIGGLDDYLNNVANLLGPDMRLGDTVWFKAFTIPAAVLVTVPALASNGITDLFSTYALPAYESRSPRP